MYYVNSVSYPYIKNIYSMYPSFIKCYQSYPNILQWTKLSSLMPKLIVSNSINAFELVDSLVTSNLMRKF